MCVCVQIPEAFFCCCSQSLWWFYILWNWWLHPSWTALLHLLLWNNVLLCFLLPWLILLCFLFWLLFNHWDVQVSVWGTWSSYMYLFLSYVDDFQICISRIFSSSLWLSLLPSDILRWVLCKLNMFKGEPMIFFTLCPSIGSYLGLKISCLIHTFLWHM